MAPPAQVTGPVKVAPVPCRLPPLTSSRALCVPPLTLTKLYDVDPLISSVPAPLVARLFRFCVPEVKSTTAPLAMAKLPVLVPPPESSSRPAFTATLPVLLNATPRVVTLLPVLV